MRNKIKRALQIATALLVVLFFLLYFAPSWIADSDSADWLPLVQLIAAPFELFALAILWVAYIAYPSLRKSLTGGGAQTKTTHPTRISTVGSKREPITQRPNYVARALSVLSLLIFSFGAILLLNFWRVGGPNKGDGHHFFHSTNAYMDMQIGLVCISIGALLALVNLYVSRTNSKAG